MMQPAHASGLRWQTVGFRLQTGESGRTQVLVGVPVACGLGIPEPEAVALGRMFRQAALVVGTSREPARLVGC